MRNCQECSGTWDYSLGRSSLRNRNPSHTPGRMGDTLRNSVPHPWENGHRMRLIVNLSPKDGVIHRYAHSEIHPGGIYTVMHTLRYTQVGYIPCYTP